MIKWEYMAKQNTIKLKNHIEQFNNIIMEIGLKFEAGHIAIKKDALKYNTILWNATSSLTHLIDSYQHLDERKYVSVYVIAFVS